MPILDRLWQLRDRLMADARFQRFAAGFPLTRPIARREARAAFDLCSGFVYSQVLMACVRLDLFELLTGEPKSLETIASQTRLPHHAAERLLAAAVSLRLAAKRSGGRYGLGPIGAGRTSGRQVGERVFVPGANCYGPVKGLFGGASSTAVLPGRRTVPMPDALAEDGTLLALAASAMHALAGDAGGATRLPDLIIGHGVVGRLLARLTLALGGAAPTVWEPQAPRRDGDFGYPVVTPEADPRRDYQRIVDASGDSDVLDNIIPRLGKGGEVVLAGFYSGRVGFAFPPAFMREARLRIAAEWTPDDMATVTGLLGTGHLSLAGLIAHRAPASDFATAYATAFDDPQCLKMVLDWSGMS